MGVHKVSPAIYQEQLETLPCAGSKIFSTIKKKIFCMYTPWLSECNKPVPSLPIPPLPTRKFCFNRMLHIPNGPKLQIPVWGTVRIQYKTQMNSQASHTKKKRQKEWSCILPSHRHLQSTFLPSGYSSLW